MAKQPKASEAPEPTMKEKMILRDKENLRKAADLILSTIHWDRSEEGLAYWEEVHKRLIEMARNL